MVDSNNHSATNTDGKGDSRTLTFEHEIAGSRERLALKGELKHGNSELVYHEVISLYEKGINEVLLDFRNLDYVDTTGLQSLVRVYKHVQADPVKKFKILVQDGELRDILRTCRFDKFIDITDDANIWVNSW